MSARPHDRGPIVSGARTELDGGWGWMIVFASFMIHAIADGVLYSFGVFYENLLRDSERSRAETSWVISIMAGTSFCSGPLSSALTNKFGCRVVTIVGALLATAGLTASTFVNEVYYLYVTIGLLTGLGFGFMSVPVIVSVSCYFDKKRALATGLAVSGSGVGTFVLAPIEENLVDFYGWQGAMMIVSGFVLNCVVFGALFRPFGDIETSVMPGQSEASESGLRNEGLVPREITTETEKNQHSTAEYIGMSDSSYQEDLNVQSEPACSRRRVTFSRRARSEQMWLSSAVVRSPTQSGLMYYRDVLFPGDVSSLRESNIHTDSLRIDGSGDVQQLFSKRKTFCKEASEVLKRMLDGSILKDLRFVLFLVCHFLISVGFNIPYVYIMDRVNEMNLAKHQKGSLLLSILGLSNTVGRLAFGFVGDSCVIDKLSVYIGSLMICGISTALSCLAKRYLEVALYCAVFGFTAGICVSLTSIIIVEIFGLDKLTNAFGLLMMFVGAASFVGPPITGFLYDRIGSYDPGFIFSGCTITASSALLIFVPKLPR